MPTDKNTLDKKRNPVRTISPEMQEHRRIMSRMTPEEKKAYKWECYDEIAKPLLLDLLEYCQNDNRICPMPIIWNKTVSSYMSCTRQDKFTKYPPFLFPLVLSAWMSSDSSKRLRFLTQIYWCYKNYFMSYVYSAVRNIEDNDWHKGNSNISKVFLVDIKKEYADWLGVNSYDPVNNSISRSIRWAGVLNWSDLNAVDHFLLDTRKIYELKHKEFTPLYEKVLNYAVDKSIESANESLMETVVLVLKDKAKDYPGLLECALFASRTNHQLKRVMYNLFREDIDEVRDYKGDGSTSFGWY